MRAHRLSLLTQFERAYASRLTRHVAFQDKASVTFQYIIIDATSRLDFIDLALTGVSFLIVVVFDHFRARLSLSFDWRTEHRPCAFGLRLVNSSRERRDHPSKCLRVALLREPFLYFRRFMRFCDTHEFGAPHDHGRGRLDLRNAHAAPY